MLKLSSARPLFALVCLSACIETAHTAPPPQAAPVGLPRGFVRTDGHGDLVISAGGAARCEQATAVEKAATLAASNAARARSGLAPLSIHPTLQRVAEKMACEMARRGTMTHVSTDGGRPGPRIKAAGYRPALTTENIAAGRMDLGRVMAEWTRSPDHLSNVVRPGLRHMGIGHATGSDGKTVYWSAIYAQPR